MIKKKVILVDIDGTISKVGERLKYLKKDPVDWDNFYESCFEDEPIKEVINLVCAMHSLKYRIVFCTGMRESVKKKTNDWLVKHIYLRPFNYTLIMRPNGDKRDDTEVKPEQLKKYNIALEDILFVIEDRGSMVKKWRELGLICLQPADGDF